MRKNATVIPTTQEAAMSINEVRSNDAITDARVKIYASRRGVDTVWDAGTLARSPAIATATGG
jgi:hypothetical protein